MNTEITVLHRKPLKEDIFDFLQERIIAGLYPPGEWLRQEDISSQLGVSMTPVREALDMLVSAGLAERVPYRGVRVLQASQEEIVDAYALRLVLECIAAHAAALQATESQVAKLRTILDQSHPLVSLKDMPRARFLNRELHQSIVSIAGNAFLYRSYLTALNTFPDWMLYEYMFRHPELLQESISTEYREHLAIVESLSARDPHAAVTKTLDHLTNRGRELEVFLGIPKDLIQQKEQQVIPLLLPYAHS